MGTRQGEGSGGRSQMAQRGRVGGTAGRRGKKFGEGICASKVDDKREIRFFMKTEEKVPK